ncbi:Coproporphyrinogen III oxidase [Candidatus Bealeia paramacronuclearis]|uniref:Oxygen-dependent coproporphyrinogen-III oxidase n=1 Tax=Candidatus Bealeia paramacronuclearis TaxID=1921001 RepID=A0ABZ2C4G1_9PROT|nr:Coproporphyrinogen III oxidase [Candidatus Bealeia paramacronuclearis]
MEDKKKRASSWFQDLQSQIIATFEAIERETTNPQLQDLTSGTFKKSSWDRPGGGGGMMAVLEGRVFEKAGVNVSTVWGEFSEEFRAQIPGADHDPRFWASGISLVVHPRSPHLPTVHMNTRFIVTQKHWFGGGADLTPHFPVEKDTADFHTAMQGACDLYDEEYYPKYKKWADDYFFLPHRNEPRGIGGIFYDYHNSENWENDFAFTQDVGKAFHHIYPEIVRRHVERTWTPEERSHQLKRRGRYVEFNLLYDRGTQFGFKTGGNTDAILMSMPPVAEWPAP